MRLTCGNSSFIRYGVIRAARNIGLMLFLTAGAASADPLRIAALGDSLTAGYGLNTEDGLVPQLQGWLDEAGVEVTIINAGLSGDTTAGGLARVGWTLSDDIDGLILALGANDYLRGLPPELARANLDGILQQADAQGVDIMVVGLEVGANFGADYKTEFDAIFPELAATYDAALYPAFFGPLLEVAGSQEGLTAYLQPDGLHPTAEAVGIIVEDLGPAVAAWVGAMD